MNKNKKISLSLKRYHQKKKTMRDVKIMIIPIVLILLSTAIIWAFKATPLNADTDRHTFLPQSEDRQEIPLELQIRMLARKHNFQWEDYLVRLIRCENLRHMEDTLDPTRTNVLGNYPAGSTDRGLMMINDYWHSEVSDECAYDLTCSVKWGMERINNNYQSEWVCNDLVLNNPKKYE